MSMVKATGGLIVRAYDTSTTLAKEAWQAGKKIYHLVVPSSTKGMVYLGCNFQGNEVSCWSILVSYPAPTTQKARKGLVKRVVLSCPRGM